MGFKIVQFEIGPMQNFMYLIGDEKSKQAMIIDPAWEPDDIAAQADKNGFTIAAMAITHAHYDHTNAILAMLKKCDVPVYAQSLEIPYSKSDCGIVGNLGTTVRAVNGEETIRLGDTDIQFYPTPGHTPGSQCIRVGNQLITGDTLFIGGCGRTDLPGGDPATLFQSLTKIAKLPSDLIVCPGHDYGDRKEDSLKNEMARNPYFQIHDQKQFIESVS